MSEATAAAQPDRPLLIAAPPVVAAAILVGHAMTSMR
jgi:hypothetical protein